MHHAHTLKYTRVKWAVTIATTTQTQHFGLKTVSNRTAGHGVGSVTAQLS